MKPSPYFVFTRSQRVGILALFVLMAALQACFFYYDRIFPRTQPLPDANWLALQNEIDSLKAAKQNYKPKIYPFNPNFITDYKGYRLGMSVREIDRLHAFREQGRFVNSEQEFQKITGVSDSLLAEIAPYFKFPDWVKNKRENLAYKKYEAKKYVVKDLNAATREELMEVYGIGPALSERIIKQREKLGGFFSSDQLKDVWGLSEEVVQKTKERFTVLSQPEIRKIPINSASLKELADFPYFRHALAKSIITYRSMNGELQSAEDLAKIKDFPVENLKTISLYLEF